MKRLFAIAVLFAGAAAPAVATGQDFGRPVYGAGRGDQEPRSDRGRPGGT
jgi:hypothetical protein